MKTKAEITFKGVRVKSDPETFGNRSNSYKFYVETVGDSDKVQEYEILVFDNLALKFCQPNANGSKRIRAGRYLNIKGVPSPGSYISREGKKITTFSVLMTDATPYSLWEDEMDQQVVREYVPVPPVKKQSPAPAPKTKAIVTDDDDACPFM